MLHRTSASSSARASSTIPTTLQTKRLSLSPPSTGARILTSARRVNPGESAWKWTTLEEYAKSVKGRPWCPDSPKDIRTPLQQVREKLAIPVRLALLPLAIPLTREPVRRRHIRQSPPTSVRSFLRHLRYGLTVRCAGQTQAQTSQRHPEVFEVQKTSLP